MTMIGSIYVQVKSDDSTFKKDMSALRQTAKKSGTEVSQALNSAISPKKASASIAALGTNLKQLAQTAKVPEGQFRTTSKAISSGMRDVAHQVGMTEKEFAQLNERMLRRQAYKTAENSLRNIARSADLSGKEIRQMAVQMGYSSKEARKMEQSITRAGRSVGGMNKALGSLKTLIPVLSGAMVVRGVQRFTAATLELGDAIAKTADSIGVSTDALQEYRYVAERSGVATGKLDEGLKTFVKRFGELRAGGGALNTVLNKYDKNLRDQLASISDTDEALRFYFEALKDVENQSDRAALAAGAFSKANGIAMTNMIDDIDVLRARYERLGLNIDEHLLRNTEDAKDSIDDLSAVIKTSFARAVLELAPDLGKAANNMAEWVAANKDFLSQDIPEHIGDIKEKIGDIKDVYDNIPSGAIETGLIGVILAGKFGPAKLAAAVVLINSQLSKMGMGLGDVIDDAKEGGEAFQNLWDVITGKKHWNTGEALGGKVGGKISKPVTAEFELIKDAGEDAYKKIGDTATATFEVMREGWVDATAEAERLSKQAHDTLSNLQTDRLTQHERMMQLIEERERDRADATLAAEREHERERERMAKERAQQEKDLAREHERVWKQATRRMDDFFTSMWSDVINGTSNALDTLRNMFSRLLAELAHMAITRPIVINAMISAAGSLGIPGVAQAGQQMLASSGGSLFGGGMPGGGAISWAQNNIPGMSFLGATLPGTSVAPIGMNAAYAAHPAYAASGAGTVGGVTLGSALGAGALGGLGYTMLGGALDLPQSPYSGLTAGLGGAAGFWGGSALTTAAAGGSSGILAGAAAGSVIPVVGTILGALGGGLLGSLFGSKPPLVEGPLQNLTLIPEWTGSGFSGQASYSGPMLRGSEGYGSWSETRELTEGQAQIFESMTEQLTTTMQGISEQINAGSEWRDFELRKGIDLMRVTGDVAAPGEKISEEKIAEQIAEILTSATKAGVEQIVRSGVAPRELEQAYSHIDWEGDYEQILGDVEFALRFRDSLKAYASGIKEMKLALDEIARGQVQEIAEGMGAFADTAVRLGLSLSDAQQAQMDYLASMVSGRETMTEMEAALYQAESYFSEFERLLIDTGYSAVEAARLAEAGWARATKEIEAQMSSFQAAAKLIIADVLGEDVGLETQFRAVFGQLTERNPLLEPFRTGALAGWARTYQLRHGVDMTNPSREQLRNLELYAKMNAWTSIAGGNATLEQLQGIVSALGPGQTIGAIERTTIPWISELMGLMEEGITESELTSGWERLNELLEQGTIGTDQYNAALSMMLDTYSDATRAEEELARAREQSIESIDQLINELTYGSLAGPRSLDLMAGRFGELATDSFNLTGQEQQEAIQDLVQYAPEYLQFAGAYGGSADLRKDMIEILQAIRTEAQGEKDFHIHVEVDGKEFAHVIAKQIRAGESELVGFYSHGPHWVGAGYSPEPTTVISP